MGDLFYLILNKPTKAQKMEQALSRVIYDRKRDELIQDVLNIKRDVDFIPTYKVSSLTKTTCERPVDFGNNFETWIKAIREEHKADEEKAFRDKKQKESFKELIDNVFAPKIMKEYSEVI